MGHTKLYIDKKVVTRFLGVLKRVTTRGNTGITMCRAYICQYAGHSHTDKIGLFCHSNLWGGGVLLHLLGMLKVREHNAQ